MIQISRKLIQLLGVILVVAGMIINLRHTVIMLLASAIILGPFYCGWLCPFGLLQDFLSILRKILKIKSIRLSNKIKKLLLPIRYIIYIFTLIFTFDFVFTIFNMDSKTTFDALLIKQLPGILPLLILIMFSILSLFIDRMYCNYFCLTGAKYGLLSYFRLFTIHKNTSTCVSCKACDKACPMDIEVSKVEHIKSIQCINCFECKTSCPIENTVTYKSVEYKSNKNKYLTTFIILILIVGYNIIIEFTSFSLESILIKEDTIIEEIVNEKIIEEVAEEEILIEIPKKSGHKNHQIESYDVETDNYDGDVNEIKNGVYTGIGYGFRGEMIVEVTIKDGNIIAVDVVSHREDRKWFQAAYPYITSLIIETQSTDVDVLSGATYSSKGIIDGVVNALKNTD